MAQFLRSDSKRIEHAWPSSFIRFIDSRSTFTTNLIVYLSHTCHQPYRQSTAGHTPLQLLAISHDLRQLASSSCQPSCANRHSTFRTRYPCGWSVLQLIWPVRCHFNVLIRYAMLVTLLVSDSIPQRNSKHSSVFYFDN
jgi:hypothetical protein